MYTNDSPTKPTPWSIGRVIRTALIAAVLVALGWQAWDAASPSEFERRLESLAIDPMATPQLSMSTDVTNSKNDEPDWQETFMGTEPDPTLTTDFEVAAGDEDEAVRHLVEQARAVGWIMEEGSQILGSQRWSGEKSIDDMDAELQIQHWGDGEVTVSLSTPYGVY